MSTAPILTLAMCVNIVCERAFRGYLFFIPSELFFTADILPSCQMYRQRGEIRSYTYLVDPDGPVNPKDNEEGMLILKWREF